MSRPSVLPGSCPSTSQSSQHPLPSNFPYPPYPNLIPQVHATPVIKLSSRTVAVIHKSHLAKKSKVHSLAWIGQRTLWKFQTFPSPAPASFGHPLSPSTRSVLFFRGPAPSEVVMRLGSSLCRLRARVRAFRACAPTTNLPASLLQPLKAWRISSSLSLDAQLTQFGLIVRCTSTQARKEAPRLFQAQRRPAKPKGAQTSHLLPPELGSLEPWKLSGTLKGPQGRPGTNASLQHRTGLD